MMTIIDAMQVRGQRGFTFLEVLIASTILLIFILAIFTAYATMHRLMTAGLLQSQAVGGARTAIERIERAVHPCTSASISSGGDRLDLVEDTNHDPYNPSNVSKAVYYTSGDGSDATLTDNRLVYDPNTAVAGDELTLTTNVMKLNSQSYFAVSGKTVTVNYSVVYTSVVVPTRSADVSTTIQMRN